MFPRKPYYPCVCALERNHVRWRERGGKKGMIELTDISELLAEVLIVKGLWTSMDSTSNLFRTKCNEIQEQTRWWKRQMYDIPSHC